MSLQATEATVVTLGPDHSIVRYIFMNQNPFSLPGSQTRLDPVNLKADGISNLPVLLMSFAGRSKYLLNWFKGVIL